MKKLFYSIGLILFLLALSSISCKKEKSDGNENEKLLIGKWNGVSLKSTYYENNVITSEHTDTFELGDEVIEFFENETGKSIEYGYRTVNFNWEIDSDILAMTTEGTSIRWEYKFTVDEDTLTLTASLESTDDGVVYKDVTYMVWERD